MRTDGAERKPAVAIRVRKVTTSAVHAGWSFFTLDFQSTRGDT
jgi:hypothetical protein